MLLWSVLDIHHWNWISSFRRQWGEWH